MCDDSNDKKARTESRVVMQETREMYSSRKPEICRAAEKRRCIELILHTICHAGSVDGQVGCLG